MIAIQTALPLLEGLNAQQREAVLATEGPVLILAGAGSGKTRVITHRIAHLILDKGVPSEAILAVTFTNKAAGEMKERTERLLEGQPLKSWISTFHSLCVRLLRREAAAAGLSRDFVIYDEDDQLQAVRQALKALDLPEKVHPPRRILSRISSVKNSGRDPEDPAGDSVGAQTFARVAELYREILTRPRRLDFDDLLLRTVSPPRRQRRACATRYRQRFRYVLVDEYQDTNRAQYELIRHLVPPAGNVTVVGDEDQSIYSWRGADINNILDFEKDFPGARVLRLEENYRSTQSILDLAGGLVAHNVKRKGKTLRAVKQSGEPVRLHQAGDEFQEAAWVVGRIAALPGAARGGGALPHERAEPAHRRGADAPGHAVPGGGRGGLLRAQGGQGRRVLPAPGPQPPRPHGAAARHQRAAARDRRAHPGRDRGRGRAAADLAVGGAGGGGDGGRSCPRGPPSPCAASAR